MLVFLLVEKADDAFDYVFGQCCEGFDSQHLGFEFVENFVDDAHDFSLKGVF
ncbi:hypothetical protein AVU38_gp198 [Ralstonia phage RSL2]|uniref:Uncharacterized protein n=1 Tax=Ralstonia phage RSL2 TaxID=1585840 RepID=A0A0A8JBF2_9CAUD|nr:hypothetical protein AVU38_gp198 [Ralstonia phage RSL2]BAQ02726.1 hypothetical protein [Ralstonia phage RSL2]